MSHDTAPRLLHDPVLCMAPGLFRSLARGDRDRPIEIDYQHGSESYAITSPCLLGADDLRVLQGVVRLGTTARLRIDPRVGPSHAPLRAALGLCGGAKHDPVLLVTTSHARLASAAGYENGRGGAMVNQLRASLTRLANVDVKMMHGAATFGWRLLAWDEDGSGHASVRIALNPRLSGCVLGEEKYVLIDMAEAGALKGDIARVLHQRLCGWIDAPVGRRAAASDLRRRVKLATLMDYAWGDGDGLPAATLRQRRKSLRAALEQLARDGGWRIQTVVDREDMYDLERPDRRAA